MSYNPNAYQHPNILKRAVGVAVGMVAVPAAVTALFIGGNKLVDRASGLDSAVAAAEASELKSGTLPPNVIIKHYKFELGDPILVSEIASDMHRFAPNQNQIEADEAIRTYLPTEEARKNYIVHAGDEFDFFVDKEKGIILPNPNFMDSAEGD